MAKRIWVRNGFVYISPDGLGPGAMDYVPARDYDELVIQRDELLEACEAAYKALNNSGLPIYGILTQLRAAIDKTKAGRHE